MGGVKRGGVTKLPMKYHPSYSLNPPPIQITVCVRSLEKKKILAEYFVLYFMVLWPMAIPFSKYVHSDTNNIFYGLCCTTNSVCTEYTAVYRRHSSTFFMLY